MSRIYKIKDSVTWKEALDEFLLDKKAQNIADSTLEEYKYRISLFFNLYPSAFNDENISKAVYQWMAEKCSPSYYNLKLNYLGAFLKFCVSKGYIKDNPLKDFKRKQTGHRIVDIDEEVIIKLLQLPDKSTYSGLRDFALLLLLLDTGIRPGEAFQLMPDDIDLKNLKVHVRPEIAKNRCYRSLPISEITARTIEKLLRIKPPEWKNTTVFCTFEGKPLNRHTWGDRLESYSKKLGVKIRPYDLRHVFALQFLRNGAKEISLQGMLGHKTLSMTRLYVDLTQKDLRAEHDNATPLQTFYKSNTRKRKIKE